MFASLWAGVLAWAAEKSLAFWVTAVVCLFLGGCVGCTVERIRPHWVFSTISPERSGN